MKCPLTTGQKTSLTQETELLESLLQEVEHQVCELVPYHSLYSVPFNTSKAKGNHNSIGGTTSGLDTCLRVCGPVVCGGRCLRGECEVFPVEVWHATLHSTQGSRKLGEKRH